MWKLLWMSGDKREDPGVKLQDGSGRQNPGKKKKKQHFDAGRWPGVQKNALK